ncbi:hypothetical protein CO131_00895 [Candidatus Kaiserbacteria bacterium CG_4_9_14_3_um_filter_50_16]|uniref:Uncharacterized protein n=1 Tax=Candidatus Kaiserbacteria bacterium CG08_land_8_20_14_0_20_50_21 TaxID=1974604 RepID=A0A2H0YX95_9BACT|nr:MAG: hypothetical protein AUJ45_00400 [Parcubacteria group bacterium CG1_02_50_68]PIS43121.1 MAG: hypothetical protein COT23_02965 [Candidatus Kaiserbacteria bacterium CG08_land_8_20_14_0_20_50_21]PIU82252.1 MAG: hypothetical protein COS69_00420 [Candidatus Kaiserbacteria bacterium CG06_land_8_20_14_3_00_49_31]PIW96401.1 MAG: hypothetical protein COZ83_01095 [Candidatus Kaiserbacteria bacterium CG_4_8_14_3_um_filter_50_23]PJA00327.1 MAG: hypothetical protein COX76_01970 [Candidatus Kaiserbac
MSLDYSQKRLLGFALHKKGRGNQNGILSSMKKKKNWKANLEIYAFWTGFLSTIISLLQVIVITLKK